MASRVLHVQCMLSILVCNMLVGELSRTSKWRLEKKRREEVVAAAVAAGLEPPPVKRKPHDPRNCQKCHQRLSSKCKVHMCLLLYIAF